ncbi:class I SAM-dependent methyltransferase [Flaviramulus sp. BrNp1-15]|uniref:THUMP-like domain-containing protein n=1 Tax=Flaviramulus sp. BrNp1-15 TaxID=2916754 RepID=UPI001EE809D1|nr:class I SAM-dependent methyltransferase [Flaviramulus sp. BrNp1-15]ULC58437.1 class I SAM-dependent methyltransferase [Flaviramulus sp. BrNp1-15]
MNKAILNIEIQEFIHNNLNSDITSILLKGTNFTSVETSEIIEQIEAKKRCEKKLQTWFTTQNIFFPNKLNIEQTSSEITAQYKSSLIEGNSIIDLTGGFGVDCYYFSKHFKTVEHCEINETLSNIVSHNYEQFNVKNINTINTDGIEYLKTTKKQYNWIYIDPSRRHESKGKVFFLKDCLPNVPEHLELLFNHSKNIMIKTSPLLDISIGIGELKHVKTIHIVAVNNEVKELLWVIEHGFDKDIQIETVNLKKEHNDYFSFTLKDEKNSESKYSEPLTYLYEPNSAILKAGAFNEIAKQLHVFKLHKHSHLYTSKNLINFPGRSFLIEESFQYNKKELKKLGFKRANITTRNFPETVQQVRKKFGIKDGGDKYLFFTTNLNGDKILISTTKLN